MPTHRRYNPPAVLKIGPRKELVTRTRAAEILGISHVELRRREKDKVYPFEVDPETGWHWYNENELRKIAGLPPKVDDMPKKQPRAAKVQAIKAEVEAKWEEIHPQVYDGDVAAKVFAELDEGRTPVQIVMKLKLHPDTVRAIRDAWLRLLEGFHLSKKDLERIAELPLKGDVKLGSVDELVTTLTASLQPVQCAKCKAKPARICTACIEPSRENGNGSRPGPIYGSGAKDM